MTKILLTGATSFIGSHFIERILDETNWEVYSIERLPVRPSQPRVHQLFHDLRAEVPQQIIDHVRDSTYMVHLAADVSGIKSLANPELTVTTNVVGTYHTLELARKLSLKKFIFVSTGEVVGAMPTGAAAEDQPLRPSNPYAASKAAAEALVNAYRVSFEVPAVIVRSMNVFGPRQQLTRFVPMVLKSLIEGQAVRCHVDPHGRCGSRNWLHVGHLVKSLVGLLGHGSPGAIYHAVGPESSNLEVINILAKALDKLPVIERVVPGVSHDFRYALRDTKGLNIGGNLDEDLSATARWYDANRRWLR